MSCAVSGRKVTSVISLSSSSQESVRRQRPETTSWVRPERTPSISAACSAPPGLPSTRLAQRTIVSTPSTGWSPPSIERGDQPVLGVDTIVRCASRVLGKPGGAEQAAEMLGVLSGRTHEVVSGLCLRTDSWEELDSEMTLVTFRPLTAHDIAAYISSGEWRDRAGAYAIQGLGATLVERIEGDYLNVVGLPAALLVRVLARRFPGTYGIG